MLAAFETRLAAVLGASLSPPFAGRVTVAPLTPNGVGPVLQVAVGAVRRAEPDVGSFRQEQPPGLPTLRRVARLEADITISVSPQGGGGAGRPQTVTGVESLLYLLDSPTFRSGEALVQAGDQGFLLQSLALTGATVPVNDTAAQVDLTVSGWFWPVGEPGAAGVAIDEVHVRQFSLPVILQAPRLVAGAGAANLSLGFGRAGTMVVEQDTVSTLPFGQMLVSILAPDGSPGAGVMAGGVAGGPDAQIVDIAAGPVAFTYTPPGAAGTDILVLRAVQADGGTGVEIARFDLVTEAGP